MSHSVYLTNAGPVPSHQEGGIIEIGGSSTPAMEVTYNYGPVYRAVGHEYMDWSIKTLNGRKASDTVLELEGLVQELGTMRAPNYDYWEATPGNAGHAIKVLLGWAKLYPDGVWEVS